MSGLKQLRNRVKSIKSTQKITKAMQMVAASKLKKVKGQLDNSEKYLDIVSDMVFNVSSFGNLDDLSLTEQKYFSSNQDGAALFILFSSERGLCGGFNSSVIRRLKSSILELERGKRNIKLIIIGKKGYDALKNIYPQYIDSKFNIVKNDIETTLNGVKQRIIDMVENGEVAECYFYFNKFKNAMVQILTKQCLFPVKSNESVIQGNLEQLNTGAVYEYEGEGLVLSMINLYVKASLNFAILHSKASEEGARMTAMDNATKNAEEMINKLTLKLNRSRQAIITKELIEIISGAEAV